MISRGAFSILHSIQSERGTREEGRKDSLAQIVDIMNRENISSSLNALVQEKFLRLKKNQTKLRESLNEREEYVTKLSSKFMRESFILEEERYRSENIDGYAPTDNKIIPDDFREQAYGKIVFEEEVEEEIDENSGKAKRLSVIINELKTQKNELVRRKNLNLNDFRNKERCLQIYNRRIQQKAENVEEKLSVLRKREDFNERWEKSLDGMELDIYDKMDEIKRKKEKVKNMKCDIVKYRQYLLSDKYNERTFLLRREEKRLERVFKAKKIEEKKAKKKLSSDRKIMKDLSQLQGGILQQKEKVLHKLTQIENRVKIEEMKQTEIKPKRKKKKRRSMKKLIRLRRRREGGSKNLEKDLFKKKAKPVEIPEIPEIRIDLIDDEVDERREELKKQEEINKKEIREVAKEVTNFKKEFSSLFSKIDVVRERMEFYDSESTPVSTPNSERMIIKKGPRGRVAIVMTDVQSSTHLWEKDILAMRNSMRIHNEIARSLIARNNGYEIRTEGDAFIVAFPKAYLALKFALAFQTELLDAEWPKGILDDPSTKTEHDEETLIFRGLRVRIGIHVGSPIIQKDPITNRDDYQGPMMHKVAAVEALGKGGLIAISEDTFRSVRGCFGTKTNQFQFDEREVQQRRLGCRVFMKLLGYSRISSTKKREVIRWITPYTLRKRCRMVTNPNNPTDFRKMRNLVEKLSKRRKELDVKRNEIRNRLNNQIQLRTLSASNSEKDGIITFLRKKVKHLKSTYEKALEKRKNPFIEEEDEFKRELNRMQQNYNSMKEKYLDLKKNFVSVENVFRDQLKVDLSRFRYELDDVCKKLTSTEKRHRFNRKVCNIEKDLLIQRVEDGERMMRKNKLEIMNLTTQVKRMTDQRDEFFRRGSKIITEEENLRILLDEKKDDDDDDEVDLNEYLLSLKESESESEEKEKKKSNFLGDDMLLGSKEQEYLLDSYETRRRDRLMVKKMLERKVKERILEKKRRLGNNIEDENEKKKKKNDDENNESQKIHRLPRLGSDIMIRSGNTNLIIDLNKSRHNEMAKNDILQLERLKVAIFSLKTFNNLKLEISMEQNESFYASHSSSSSYECLQQQQQQQNKKLKKQKKNFITRRRRRKKNIENNNVNRENLFYFQFSSKRERMKWVSEKVEEIHEIYKKLGRTKRWNGSLKMFRKVLLKIRSLRVIYDPHYKHTSSSDLLLRRAVMKNTYNNYYNSPRSSRNRSFRRRRRRKGGKKRSERQRPKSAFATTTIKKIGKKKSSSSIWGSFRRRRKENNHSARTTSSGGKSTSRSGSSRKQQPQQTQQQKQMIDRVMRNQNNNNWVDPKMTTSTKTSSRSLENNKKKKKKKKKFEVENTKYDIEKEIDIIKRERNERGFISYSRLLQNMPMSKKDLLKNNRKGRKRRRRKEEGNITSIVSEKRSILESLYFDKNALNYSHILPRNQ